MKDSVEPNVAIGSQVVEVQDRHRIVIPVPIAAVIPWLHGNDPFSCLAVLNGYGGIQIDKSDGDLGSRFNEVVDLAASVELKASDTSNDLIHGIRSVSGAFRTYMEGRPRRFVIPDPIRRLSLLPSNDGQDVVISYAGGILEIWPPHDWIQYLRQINATFVNTLSATASSLSRRIKTGVPTS